MREPRRPQLFLSALIAALLLPAAAGATTLDMTGGTFSLTIGALPGITGAVAPAPGFVVSSATGGYTLPGGIMPVNVVLVTQLFTGVSLISSLNVDMNNATGTFAAGAGLNGGFGSGSAPLSGAATVGVLGGLINLIIPLGNVGSVGATQVAAAALFITVTGTAWTTGTAVVTGITTTITTTTTGGNVQIDAVLNTLTLTGYDNRTAGHAGKIMLVTPIRILTNAAGNLPAFATQVLDFVPEPSRMLMLVSAAAGLWTVGQLRRRR